MKIVIQKLQYTDMFPDRFLQLEVDKKPSSRENEVFIGVGYSYTTGISEMSSHTFLPIQFMRTLGEWLIENSPDD